MFRFLTKGLKSAPSSGPAIIPAPAPTRLAHDDYTPQVQTNRLLLAACASKNLKKVEEYLSMGAEAAWKNANSGFTSDPLRDHTALSLAAAAGSLPIVSVLLRTGAQVNTIVANGGTALMSAAAGGHLDILRLLLKNHADPRVVDEHGNTAFTYAVKGGHHSVASDLGRDARSIGPVQRAFHFAVAAASLECIQMTVVLGADVNAPSEQGVLALAQIRELYESQSLDRKDAAHIAAYLVSKGADIDLLSVSPPPT